MFCERNRKTDWNVCIASVADPDFLSAEPSKVSLSSRNGANLCLPFKYAPLIMQTWVQPDRVSSPAFNSAILSSKLAGSLDMVRSGSSKTECIHPKHTAAANASCLCVVSAPRAAASGSMRVRRSGGGVAAVGEGGGACWAR